jgi:hypothetical protein
MKLQLSGRQKSELLQKLKSIDCLMAGKRLKNCKNGINYHSYQFHAKLNENDLEIFVHILFKYRSQQQIVAVCT